MPKPLFAPLCVAIPAVLACAPAPAAEAPVSVELHLQEHRYVLGQPVLLDITVTNTTRETIQAWEVFVERFEPEIQVHIATDGQTFVQHPVGIFALPLVFREAEPIEPGKSRRYRLRVLYSHEQPDRIAFGAPGDYWIKVRYPLIMPKAEPSERLEIDSNTTRITFERPTGIDAKLWEVIQAPEYFYFLQSGLVQGEHKEVVEAAIKILTELPDSAYHSAFRWALNEHYASERNRVTSIAQIEYGEAIRKALGIEEEVYFSVPGDPDRSRDKRLERVVTYGSGVERPAGHVPVTYGSGHRFPLENVLRDISRQSGVELRLDRAISPESPFRSRRKTTMLRQFMQALVEPGRTTWVRDGDAYVLTLVADLPRDSSPSPKTSQESEKPNGNTP